MRRWIAASWPAVLTAGWLISLFAPLLSPRQALANRDIPLFHLPLRATFRQLAAFGLPTWTPWVHGGQPILSNPSYGAFYPPSWLIFLAPAHYALTLMALLHGALAFAGAWRLARHLGCSRGVAAVAGIGYAGCGAYLSQLSAYTLLGGLTWLPWVLVWGDAALRAPAGRRWWRPALLAGTAMGLQLLNGEPSTVVMSGLALLALAASAAGRRLAAAPRVLVPPLFALALAAVQLLPTLDRLADSVRTEMPAAHATLWSMRPARLVEVVFPRFYGSGERAQEGFFFGWKVNDRAYPYVESLYPGLLLTVLGASALLRWRIPRRAAWGLAALLGFALALGRYGPVYETLRRVIPGLSVLRYPEKFAALGVLALSLAGVLGWQRLLDERRDGRPAAADFPLGLALLALAAALFLAALLYFAPGLVQDWIVAQGAPGLPPALQTAALSYLRREGWAAVATAAAVVFVLALCRWPRPSRRVLEVLAAVLLAADLWHYGHGLPRVVPASIYLRPPPLAAALLPVRHRVYVQQAPPGFVDRVPREGDPRSVISRTFLFRLQPYGGLLWDIPYAFEIDFDLMLTSWGRKADDILADEWRGPEGANRFLGAWNVGTLILKRTNDVQPPVLDLPSVQNLRQVTNVHVLPRFRFVQQVSFYPNHAAALAAALARGWRIARHEHCVRPGQQPSSVVYPRPPRALELADEGGRIRVRYRAEGGAFFVAAMTFDPQWRASLEGRPLSTFPTAAGQLGVALPPGEHRLLLEYHQRLLGPGAALSLTALAAAAAALLWPGRRRRMA